jgi:hypothetical protein
MSVEEIRTDHWQCLAFWGKGYANEGYLFVNNEWFTEEEGYSREDIRVIKNLGVGEVWRADEVAVHFVVKLK